MVRLFQKVLGSQLLLSVQDNQVGLGEVSALLVLPFVLVHLLHHLYRKDLVGLVDQGVQVGRHLLALQVDRGYQAILVHPAVQEGQDSHSLLFHPSFRVSKPNMLLLFHLFDLEDREGQEIHLFHRIP